jgi:hypothetical protein
VGKCSIRGLELDKGSNWITEHLNGRCLLQQEDLQMYCCKYTGNFSRILKLLSARWCSFPVHKTRVKCCNRSFGKDEYFYATVFFFSFVLSWRGRHVFCAVRTDRINCPIIETKTGRTTPQNHVTVKYGLESCGTWNQEWMCWRGPAENYCCTLMSGYEVLLCTNTTVHVNKCNTVYLSWTELPEAWRELMFFRI